MLKSAEVVLKPEQFHEREGLLSYISQSDLRSARPASSLVSISI